MSVKRSTLQGDRRIRSLAKQAIALVTSDKVLWSFVAVLGVLWLIAPFFVAIDGGDGSYHRIWIGQFAKVLNSGSLIPRWLPDSFAGLGAPTFYFYCPVAYYLTSLFSAVVPTATVDTVYFCVSLIVTVASIVSFWYLGKEFSTDERSIWLAAAIYGLAPIRFYDIYIMNTFSAHAAFAIVPLIVGTLTRMVRGRRTAQMFFLLSVGWALLLLTNVPLSIMTAMLCSAYLLALLRRDRVRYFLLAISAVAVGSGISLYHYLPVLHFQKFARLQYLWRDTYSAFKQNFFIENLLKGRDLTVTGISVFDALGTLAVIFLWLWARRQARHDTNTDPYRLLGASAIIGVLILYLNTPFISQWVWYTIPFFKLIQWNFRFEICELFIGCFVLVLWSRSKRVLWLKLAFFFWLFTGTILAGMNILHLRVNPKVPIFSQYEPPEYATIYSYRNPYDVINFCSDHKNDSLVFVEGLTVPERIQLLSRKPEEIVWRVTLSQPRRILLHLFYWPQWHLRVNGTLIHGFPSPDGRYTAVLPSGSYEARLTLDRHPSEIAGLEASGISLILLFGITLTLVIYQRRKERLHGQLPFAEATLPPTRDKP